MEVPSLSDAPFILPAGCTVQQPCYGGYVPGCSKGGAKSDISSDWQDHDAENNESEQDGSFEDPKAVLVFLSGERLMELRLPASGFGVKQLRRAVREQGLVRPLHFIVGGSVLSDDQDLAALIARSASRTLEVQLVFQDCHVIIDDVCGRGKPDITFKVLLIGDANSGKSSLATRCTDNTFSTSSIATIGLNIKTKRFLVDGCTSVKLFLWDTAVMRNADARHKSSFMISPHYATAHAVLVVFDLTVKQSSERIDSWLEGIRIHGREDLLVSIVGNKADATAKRQESTKHVASLAHERGLIYYEVSALTGSGVAEMLHEQLGILVDLTSNCKNTTDS
eukprot:TRINITY_DN104872_c0_g1_i1.p1 TRINITY_DN104872_c0_g1~~TRINITY_DN104872_c0_g1_i1.p1  ORF type:complete len:337 (-),score=51.28 TRINITY_DN104872_c0_g1_i1:330-1340(-)